MKRKKSFLRRKPVSGDMSLQITSMADIFVIILVFLLKGFGSSAVQLTPTQGLLLPQAEAATGPIEALKIEISENAVQVEGAPITQLKKFQIAGLDRQGDGSIKSLHLALEKERKRQNLIAQNNSTVKVDSKVILVADQRTPYETIKSVLSSAALNGFTDFKLAVVRGE